MPGPGVKEITPPMSMETVPPVTGIDCATPGVRATPPMLAMASGSPSGSLSAVSGASTIAGPSWVAAYVSPTAVGVSFTGTTVMVATAGADTRPPASVAVKVSVRLPAVGLSSEF